MLSPVAGNPVGREAAALPAGRLVGAIPQREADLVPLRVAVQRATTSQVRLQKPTSHGPLGKFSSG